MKTQICSGRCRVCFDFNAGTQMSGLGASDFVCANCDRTCFDAEAERQKARYLSGANYNQHEVR